VFPAYCRPAPVSAVDEPGEAAVTAAVQAGRPVRVVLADDNPLVLVGLRSLLADDPRVRVVGEARTGWQALLVTDRLHPDAVLLDVQMSTHDALTVLPALVRATRVLVLTYSRDPALVSRAIQLGATGYVVHAEYTTGQLIGAVLDAHRGRRHLSPSAAAALARNADRDADRTGWPPPRRLSRRETEVLQHVARGLSNCDIASALQLSEQTVKNHVSRILGKLGVRSRREAGRLLLGQPLLGRVEQRGDPVAPDLVHPGGQVGQRAVVGDQHVRDGGSVGVGRLRGHP
jgi:DNA-binding NarL/FixJ family response regulator